MILTLTITGICFAVLGFILLVKPNLIQAAGIGGNYVTMPVSLVMLIIGVFLIIFPYTSFSKAAPETLPPSPGSPSSLPSQNSSSPESPPVSLAITSPTNGTEVDGSFPVTGTAPDLGQDKLWLLGWGENATTKGMVYYRSIESPLTVLNGKWSTAVGPLGESGKDIGAIFQFKLVRANPQCSDSISQTKPNSAGELVIPTLGSGCTDATTLLVKKRS